MNEEHILLVSWGWSLVLRLDEPIPLPETPSPISCSSSRLSTAQVDEPRGHSIIRSFQQPVGLDCDIWGSGSQAEQFGAIV